MSDRSTATAADVLVRVLEDAGVTAVFSLPGEENLPVVSAIRSSPIEPVVCRHEQHAGFMAVAHARLTGGVGVCLTTLGPGALNAFTPVAQAQLVRSPLLVITGQKAARDNDEGSFQVVDVTGAARPLTKAAVSVIDAGRIGPMVRRAISTATSPPHGPVLLEIPEDVADTPVATGVQALGIVPAAGVLPDLASVNSRLERAHRPLLLAGAGCGAPAVADALTELVGRLGIPVLTTQMGKGALDEDHDTSLGTLGVHRVDHTHAALHAADLILAVGYHPAEHPPLVWNRYRRPVIHLSDSPADIEAGYEPELQVVAPLTSTLAALERPAAAPWHLPIRAGIQAGLQDERSAAERRRGDIADPLAVIAAVEAVDRDLDDVSVSLDNGVYKIWFARHYRARHPWSLFLDNALATMGAGLATGMEAARLGRRSLVVTGDGGFLMNVADLETAVRLRLDLAVLVLRDDRYGFIAWHQDEQDRDRAEVDLGNPDLPELARAFGANGHRVDRWQDLSELVRAVMVSGGVHVIDCPISYEINDLLDPARLPDIPVEN